MVNISGLEQGVSLHHQIYNYVVVIKKANLSFNLIIIKHNFRPIPNIN